MIAIVIFWLAFAVWLAHLEGRLDSYVPRILLAALIVDGVVNPRDEQTDQQGDI